MEQKKRITWIDLAKGITILLVIIGHTMMPGGAISGVIRSLIFSFHMPLFYILSAITFKGSTDYDQLVKKTERAFIHLVIPAYIMFIGREVASLILHWRNYTSLSQLLNIVRTSIVTASFASGYSGTISGGQIEFFGVVWFLVSLFIGRSLFDYMQLRLKEHPKHLLGGVILLSIVGVCIGKLQYLPFSLDTALATLPFIYYGNKLAERELTRTNYVKFGMSIGVWILGFVLSSLILRKPYLSIAHRDYPLFPLCFIVAIAGTEVVMVVCKAISEFKLFKPIQYLGKNSLYMLCIHMVDYSLQRVWQVSSNDLVNCAVRLAFDIVLFIVVMLFIEKINATKHRRKTLC